ncbi:salutaridine reductase [Quercus suber]|uniref:Salutaridine reductase n=1 Tax=Quercus suber TaxID=58331 RepID=A0AAW0M620_QUESU
MGASAGIDLWWSKDTVAIVTGANKGIEFAMVKRLAQLGLTVILTARDIEKGHKAIKELRNQGIDDNTEHLLSNNHGSRAHFSASREVIVTLPSNRIRQTTSKTVSGEVNQHITIIIH